MEITTGVLTPKEPAIDLIKILSEGTYTSFPQALKELISNSYDADATKVTLEFDEEFTSLTVHDNGVGMTSDEFKDVFMSIARGKSNSSVSGTKTAGGRQRIGRFGIGSLSIVGTASKLTVRSIKKDTGRGFQASIDLTELRQHFNKGEDLSGWWRFPSTEWGGEPLNSHLTDITIEGIREDIRELLQRPGSKLPSDFVPDTALLSGIEQLRWKLGIICPVAYADRYPVPESELRKNDDAVIINHADRLVKDNFEIVLNGGPVLRQIHLPNYHTKKLKNKTEFARLSTRGLGYEVECFQRKHAGVKCDGYLVVQAAALFPEELRGILVRIRGVGIGWHRSFNLTSTASTMLSSMSGEVWADGLDDALQFDRESFREDHPAYVKLQSALQDVVDNQAKKFRERSASRRGKAGKGGAKAGKAGIEGAKPKQSPSAENQFLDPEIFQHQPDYICRLVPQINGCHEREWFEACAMVVRRLVETLLITLYDKKGWKGDLTYPNGDLFGLKKIINVVSTDTRLGLDNKTLNGLTEILKDLKNLGDTAAHDYRVKTRRQDLAAAQKPLRFTCERLIFKIEETGP
jgi:hypothetical protein